LPALLEQTLGLGVTRYGSYGNQADINIRGFDSERIAILIDGMPVNSPLDGDFDFTMVDVNSIEKIEVIYGGSDTKYNVSGALGGVINIITVKQNQQGYRIGGSFSNTAYLPSKYYNRQEVLDGPAWKDLLDTQNISLFADVGAENFSWSINGFANQADNHFIFTDSLGTKRRRDGNEVKDMGMNTSLVWNLPQYAKLILGGGFYQGNRNFPVAPVSPAFEKQTDTGFRQNLMLDMPRIFRDDLAMEAGLSHFGQTREYGVSLHNTNALTAVNRWSWYPLSKLTLRSGWDYRFNHVDSTDAGVRSRNDGGMYVTAEYQPHKIFLLIPSVKLVFSENEVVPVPKLGFLWTPGDSFTVKNNYFRSFKFPDFEDLYWDRVGYEGNPDLKSEDGWGADLGAAYRYKKWFSVESTFYTEWTRDSIHWDNSSGIWRPENVGEALYFGLDSKARFEIPVSLGPVKKLVPSLSYQYLLSYLLSYGYTFDSGKRIPYMPAHTLGVSLEIPWDTAFPGSLVILGHYESDRDVHPRNRTRLDPYVTLTVNVNQKIGKNLSVFAVVRNALNTSYQSFYGYPMPGLTFTLGMRMNYEHQ
jgi:vitamin B12 transporter